MPTGEKFMCSYWVANREKLFEAIVCLRTAFRNGAWTGSGTLKKADVSFYP